MGPGTSLLACSRDDRRETSDATRLDGYDAGEDTSSTVALPVYNSEHFPADALVSIMGQTFQDFVLVVFGTASTGATVDIVENHAACDDRIVLLRSDLN